ncbi:Ribonuclease H-like superfamily [Sesbania bispinosa]|nr:Ribonuclease H-like superfamily [Sesbania bispinosa]
MGPALFTYLTRGSGTRSILEPTQRLKHTTGLFIILDLCSLLTRSGDVFGLFQFRKNFVSSSGSACMRLFQQIISDISATLHLLRAAHCVLRRPGYVLLSILIACLASPFFGGNGNGGIKRLFLHPDASGRWLPPAEPFFKLNVDDSFHLHTLMMGAGGLIRDSLGHWIRGFSSFEACGDSLSAELIAIFRGLEVARDLQLNDNFCGTDSEVAVQLILNLKTTNDPSYFQYQDFHSFLWQRCCPEYLSHHQLISLLLWL